MTERDALAALGQRGSTDDKLAALAVLEKSKTKGLWLQVARSCLPAPEPLRMAVTKTLKRLGADVAAAALPQDSDSAELTTAYLVLRTLQPGTARAAFLRGLTHLQPSVRREAALGLAVVGVGDACAQLLPQLGDADREVRLYVVQALRAVAGQAPVAAALRAQLALEADAVVGDDLRAALRDAGQTP